MAQDALARAFVSLACMREPLVIAGGGSAPWMHDGARTLAAAAVDGRVLTLDGQTHDVDRVVLAAALEEFLH